MESGVISRDEFPLPLLEWRGCPENLWFQGNRGLLEGELLVSVVGTRNPSHEGIMRTRKLVQTLVREGAIVVSGMALGVDYIAHTTTLGLGGATIAVMGTPIGDCYPREHRELKTSIVTFGLVLSQFEPGTPSRRHNFPRRNETMAAMSALTIVTEASASSGTRHQVAAAIKLGRRVGFLASLVAQQIPWIEDALQSELSFVIESPSQLADVVARCRTHTPSEAKTGAMEPTLSATLGADTWLEHLDFDQLKAQVSPVGVPAVDPEDSIKSVEQEIKASSSNCFASWVKRLIRWVFGDDVRNRPKK